jgi:hypothetical protein
MNHYELLATIASILTSGITPVIVLSMSLAKFREDLGAQKTAGSEIHQVCLLTDQGCSVWSLVDWVIAPESFLAEDARVVESLIAIKSGDEFHLLLG